MVPSPDRGVAVMSKDTFHTDTGLYDNPSWYDVLHAKDTAWEVDGLESIASRYVRTRSGDRNARWLEPACGTGRYLRESARRGIETEGYDADPSMIAYAKARFDARGLDGVIRVGNMTDYRARTKADFAFNTINTIRHLMSDGDILAHLESTHASLLSGGVYAVGLSTANYSRDQPVEDVWTGARGRLRVTQVVNYLPAARDARREMVVNHLHVETPSREVHADSTYELRTYSRGEWMEILERSPFELIAVTDEFGEPVPMNERGEYAGRYGVYVLG